MPTDAHDVRFLPPACCDNPHISQLANPPKQQMNSMSYIGHKSQMTKLRAATAHLSWHMHHVLNQEQTTSLLRTGPLLATPHGSWDVNKHFP